MPARSLGAVLTLAVLTLGTGLGHADDTKKQPDPADDDLFEFLGSVDPSTDPAQSDDGAWLDYLSQTDLGKVIKPATLPPGTPTSSPASPAKASGSKDET